MVITVRNQYREEEHDPWMLEISGTDYKTYDCKCLDPITTRKIGVGDLGLRMLPFLVNEIKSVVKKEKPDFILYPVPPWFVLSIAPIIQSSTKIPYGIDFIDPWVVEERPVRTWKQRINHQLALFLERKACTKASIIFSVSEGINNNLRKRYSSLKDTPMFSVPYGAEVDDFRSFPAVTGKENFINIRYIGAVWPDAYPVLKAFLAAFARLTNKLNFRLEFYGTSYANPLFAEPQVHQFVETVELQEKVTERPSRVPFKKAVQLTMESDFLLLFGGMQPYYAASKLFGLIASQKPFLAFLHKDSFPAKFLKGLEYPYLIEYSGDADERPFEKIGELESKILQIGQSLEKFEPIALTNPAVKEHSGYGMASKFINEIRAVV